MDVSSQDFEAQPSHFLRRAEAGETIVVTDHGRAIAELGPARASVTTEETVLLELVNSGVMTPPARKKTTSRSPGLCLGGTSISQAILEGREDRF